MSWLLVPVALASFVSVTAILLCVQQCLKKKQPAKVKSANEDMTKKLFLGKNKFTKKIFGILEEKIKTNFMLICLKTENYAVQVLQT